MVLLVFCLIQFFQKRAIDCLTADEAYIILKMLPKSKSSSFFISQAIRNGLIKNKGKRRIYKDRFKD